MRILHVYKTYYPEEFGGGQLAIQTLCEGARRFGHEAEVFTLAAAGQPRRSAQDNHMVNRSPRLGRVASMDFSFGSILEFRRLAGKFDLIHYHFPWPWMDVMHLFRRCDRPCIVTYLSDVVKQRYLYRLYKPLQRYFLSRVDRIVASSPNYAASSKVLSEFAEKVQIIPFGIDPERYAVDPGRVAFWRERLGNDFFLFVGALRYYKGLEYLLAAAERSNGSIVIVGGGYCEETLRESARRKGLGNVCFLGTLPEADKIALLALCRGFVFPSHKRSESFGLALLEAMLFGKPLVTCEIGTGTSYVNIDGVTGFVVPPEDPDALAEAMRRLRENAELACRMGEAGKVRFDELFTADAMVREYAALYEEVATSGGRRP